MKIKTCAISDITPDPNNARSHDERNMTAITESLMEFDQYAPLVVQKSTGRIIAGNGRYAAMRAMGRTRVDVVEYDCDDETAARISLADNRTSELASWDIDKLSDVFAEFDVDELIGWTEEEIESISCIDDDNAQETESTQRDELNDELERRVFYLAAPQAGHVDQMLSRAAEVFSPEDIETHGNTNANGNLLYKIMCEWEIRVHR